MYDQRVEEAVARAARALSRGGARRVAVAGDQARLHRPAARAPAAGMRRDLLQLGRLPGAAPALLPQRVHLLAPGGGDRAPRGRGADLPLLLSRWSRRLAHDAPRASRASFGLKNRWEDPQRDLRNVVRALRPHFPRPARAQPDLQIQVLCSLFFRNKAAYIVGRMINAHRELPFAVPILQNERGELYLDTLLVGRGPAAGAVLVRARLLLRRHGGAGGVRLVPALADADASRAPSSTWRSGSRKQGKTLFYRDLHYHLKHSTDRFVRRARHQGHGDAGVHAALVPVRLQGDPRPLRAAQGHRPRRRCSRST